VYNYEIIQILISKIELINSNKNCNRLIKLLLHYLEDQEIIHSEQITLIKKKIINIKEGVDNYVPTDQEMLLTLNQLTPNNRLVYLVYLVSGARKVEGKYLIEKLDSLKSQQLEGYVKISMNYLRHNKNSFFCYLPLEVYTKLQLNYKQLSISSLERELKNKKLIAIKYCRKWFYTKCIELGIPESIADYYEGRVSNGVGSNHYLSRQLLADQNYKKIVSYLNKLSDFNKTIYL